MMESLCRECLSEWTARNLTAVTDVNGEFKINADTSVKAGKIRADYIGFKGVETLAKVNQPVNIALKPDHAQLNEIVAVGYGAFGKKEQAVDSNQAEQCGYRKSCRNSDQGDEFHGKKGSDNGI